MKSVFVWEKRSIGSHADKLMHFFLVFARRWLRDTVNDICRGLIEGKDYEVHEAVMVL